MFLEKSSVCFKLKIQLNSAIFPATHVAPPLEKNTFSSKRMCLTTRYSPKAHYAFWKVRYPSEQKTFPNCFVLSKTQSFEKTFYL